MKQCLDKQRLTVMKKIFDHSHNKQWECIETGCSEPAINSHLLQRHGVLSNIVENGHLIEVRGADMMRWNEENAQVFQFKKVGLQQAISVTPLLQDLKRRTAICRPRQVHQPHAHPLPWQPM